MPVTLPAIVQITFSHSLRASELKTTKKTKRKNPWSELKKTKLHWRAKAVSRLVSTPIKVNNEMTHVNPSRIMIPERDRISLQASLGERGKLLLVRFCLVRLRLCLMIITTTAMKTLALKRMRSNMGTKKPVKKTPK